MDYEAIKEQWGDVEDRDGIRLSWNVFPSSRMVGTNVAAAGGFSLTQLVGSIQTRRPHRSSVHALEGEGRHPVASIRACDLQTAMPFCLEPFLV